MTVGVERPPRSTPVAVRTRVVRIHPDDNVAVAVTPIEAGEHLTVDGVTLTAKVPVPAGHKVALVPIATGDVVTKYGFPIGSATSNITAGEWIHSHNLATRLSGTMEYAYHPSPRADDEYRDPPTFLGYRRANGRVGTRNEIWVLNTVGCVNHAAERIARMAADRYGKQVDGVHAFSHPYGCSQLGDDLRNTQRVLGGLMRHPNAGGVLLLGLGCENNQVDSLLQVAGDIDRSRLRVFNTQDVMDEIAEGGSGIGELVARMADDKRDECPASDLILGHKCGGSDGFSGISANPLVGRIADRITAMGGGVILTEVPEMFGAEQVLLDRAANESVFADTVGMINDFKDYFTRHDQPIYENPSPGNKAGGLTTLEEKSLGAIQKGGRATVERVLRYGDAATTGGLSLLESPGNDGVSSTAMTVSGATVLLFTTGRGTPLGFPVPTIKISSNSDIAARKPHWIDFDAGPLLDGSRSQDELADELLQLILDVASGKKLARNEEQGYREIAIWKEGVTL
ncbi:MAG TPA: altronate dehydratase family protein [Gemmatimonadaceae bacterium]|nr:altronate dehydratase family protein [Gemmatimonadaceae bacterium]